MKNTLLIIFGICLLNCAEKPKSESSLNIDVEKQYVENSTKCIDINAVFTNKSLDTINYLSKNCSYAEFYISNNKNLTITIPSCDKNIGKIITLAPGQAKAEKLKCQVDPNVKFLNFRIAFLFYQLTGDKFTIGLDEKMDKNRVVKIWSKPINLKFQ